MTDARRVESVIGSRPVSASIADLFDQMIADLPETTQERPFVRIGRDMSAARWESLGGEARAMQPAPDGSGVITLVEYRGRSFHVYLVPDGLVHVEAMKDDREPSWVTLVNESLAARNSGSITDRP